MSIYAFPLSVHALTQQRPTLIILNPRWYFNFGQSLNGIA